MIKLKDRKDGFKFVLLSDYEPPKRSLKAKMEQQGIYQSILDYIKDFDEGKTWE